MTYHGTAVHNKLQREDAKINTLLGQERLKDAPKLTEKDIQAFLEEEPK